MIDFVTIGSLPAPHEADDCIPVNLGSLGTTCVKRHKSLSSLSFVQDPGLRSLLAIGLLVTVVGGAWYFIATKG